MSDYARHVRPSRDVLLRPSQLDREIRAAAMAVNANDEIRAGRGNLPQDTGIWPSEDSTYTAQLTPADGAPCYSFQAIRDGAQITIDGTDFDMAQPDDATFGGYNWAALATLKAASPPIRSFIVGVTIRTGGAGSLQYSGAGPTANSVVIYRNGVGLEAEPFSVPGLTITPPVGCLGGGHEAVIGLQSLSNLQWDDAHLFGLQVGTGVHTGASADLKINLRLIGVLV